MSDSNPANAPIDLEGQPMFEVLVEFGVRPGRAYNIVQGLRHMSGEKVIGVIRAERAEILAELARTNERIAATFAQLDHRITEGHAQLDGKIAESHAQLDRKITESHAQLDGKIAELDRRMTESHSYLDRRITEGYAYLDKRITDGMAQTGGRIAELDARITETSATANAGIAKNTAAISSLRWMMGVVILLLSVIVGAIVPVAVKVFTLDQATVAAAAEPGPAHVSEPLAPSAQGSDRGTDSRPD